MAFWLLWFRWYYYFFFFRSSLLSSVHQKWCHSSYLETQVWKRMCQKWLLLFLYSFKAYQLFSYTFLHTVSMDLTKAVMCFNFQHWHLFTKKFKTIAIKPLRNLAMGVCMLISIFVRHTLNGIFAQLRILFTNVCVFYVQIHWNVRHFDSRLHIFFLLYFNYETTSSKTSVQFQWNFIDIMYMVVKIMAHSQIILIFCSFILPPLDTILK